MGASSETIDLILQSKSDLREFKRARTEISGIRKAMDEAFAGLKIGGGMAVVNQLMAGASRAIAAAREAAIDFNATLEQQEVAFKTLLGTADAAKIRIADLFRFAAETPFEFEQILQASRILQSLTNGALASGDGLRMVGDVAAATARPIEEVAMWLGRVFAGLKTGTAIGEASLRLIEMGAISGDTARRLNTLAASGAGMSDAMGIMHREFGRFSGAMIEQSKTFNGQLSTLRDNLKGLVAENTKGAFEALKATIEGLNRALTSDAAKEYVEWLNRVIDLVTLIPRAAGAASGGNVGPSATANVTLQAQALEETIRKIIKAKRDQGEIDDDIASKLAMQLRLVQLTEDAQDRLRRGIELSANLRGAAPRAKTVEAAAPAELTDAQKTLSGDLFKNFLEAARANLDERQRLEVDYADKVDQIQTALSENSEARKAALFQLDQMFAHRRRELDEKETQAALEREADAAEATLAIERDIERAHLDRLQREMEADDQRIENRLQTLNILRAQSQTFLLTNIQKRKLDRQSLEAEVGLLRGEENQSRFMSNMAGSQEERDMHARRANAFASRRAGTETQLNAFLSQGDPQDMSDQFGQTFISLQDQWGSVAQQMAQNFEQVFNSAIATISNGITGLIVGTLTWDEALRNIGLTILTDIVQAIVQMGVRWILTQILMATVGKSIQAASLAANAGIAAAQAAVWATPATLSTIASYGGAAYAAPGQIALAEGIVMAQSLAAFEQGGYTGTGNSSEVAGIVHRGEYVIPAPTVKEYGTAFFDRLMQGSPGGMRLESTMLSIRTPDFVNNVNLSAPAHPAASRSKTVLNIAHYDQRSAGERWLSTLEGERFLVDWMRRTQHEVAG